MPGRWVGGAAKVKILLAIVDVATIQPFNRLGPDHSHVLELSRKQQLVQMQTLPNSAESFVEVLDFLLDITGTLPHWNHKFV